MKKKTFIIWIIVFAVVIIISTFAFVYAYFAINEFKYGSFNVDITSKGVDTLEIINDKPIKLSANWRNFNIENGHDLTGKSNIDIKLQTTSPESQTYCYELNLNLAKENNFVYSKEGFPEILISVLNKENNEKLINNLDITTKNEMIRIPTKENGNEYKFSIKTTKNNLKMNKYEAELTLKWYPDINQVINLEKTFYANLEANIVDC